MEIIRNITIEEAFDISGSSNRLYLAGDLRKAQPRVEEIHTKTAEREGAYEAGISTFETFTCEKPHVHTYNDEYNYIVSGAVKVYLFNEIKDPEILLLPGDFYVIHKNEPYIAKACAGTKVLFSKVPGGNDKRILKENEYSLPKGWKDRWNENNDREEKQEKDGWKKRVFRFFRLFWQALLYRWPVFGYLVAGYGLIIPMIREALSGKSQMRVNLISLGILVAVYLFIVAITAMILYKDRFEMKKNNHKLIVMKDDFVKNFKKLLKEEKTIPLVVLGIDTSLDLNMSTATGIIRGLTSYMASECGLPQAEFQKRIDKAYNQETGRTRETGAEAMELEEMLLVKNVPLRIQVDKNSGKYADPTYVSFLLIANSRKKDLQAIETTADIEMIEPANHQRIIGNIFSFCRELSAKEPSMTSILDSIIMGAIGTNEGKMTYSVVLNEILNSFEISVRKDDVPHRLFLSIRADDIESQGFKQRPMISLIRTRIKQMDY